jgi:undecaprenyl diphosphate synthase
MPRILRKQKLGEEHHGAQAEHSEDAALVQRWHEHLHMAIIVDGNSRWAQMRGMARSAGHVAGVRALKRVIDAAPAMGVGTLTVYAFSTDNWKRPAAEVQMLMGLLRTYLERDVARLVKDGVRVKMIGRRDRLGADLAGAFARAEAATQHGRRLLLRVALDYSCRDAIVEASVRCRLNPTRSEMARQLKGALASDDVGLMIRTSGEKRLSDFLLWEAAYAELYFTSTYWPDFDACELAAALHDHYSRDRRFGALNDETAQAGLAKHAGSCVEVCADRSLVP